MKRSHSFKINIADFGGYFLDFRQSLTVKSSANVKVGDYVRMFEYDKENCILTGRNLTFEVLYVDKTPGLIGIGNVWLLQLRKLVTV